MGYKELSLKLPTDYSEDIVLKKIEQKLRIRDFTYQIDKKSLDARKKNNIHWQVKISVLSNKLKELPPQSVPVLDVNYKKRKEKIIVVGSGPAGLFSALLLQKSGFNVTLIERGSEVINRANGIKEFERTGIFNPLCNYSFGEGGAGTFSDGKLTSRTKHIVKEKHFILSNYVKAGAPKEIMYMAHPHLGSDNLIKIVKNLRKEFIEAGGDIQFETLLEDLNIKNGKIRNIITNKNELNADYFFLATGHSAYETYRMLINKGVIFNTKNFAIGYRVEHPQSIINKAQWGVENLPGIKAAEYRLTFKSNNSLPVYSFCMCPGGIIVNASAYNNINIVNGMSLYNRSGKFANAACVAGINLNELLKSDISALQALEWLENIERDFYSYSNGFKAPFCSIKDFINKKETTNSIETSYKLGLKPSPLWELLPFHITDSIREGLKNFSRKLKGFETGNIMGLESKTSSPIQTVRDENRRCHGFDNLFIIGEGSGHSGGIISSGVDGIKSALTII
ncbi:MAG: FAD-binding protein [bacterium]|nr:FAD-binding protein [bacterium]